MALCRCTDCFWLVAKCSSLTRVWLFVTPWTVACQAPLSMRFSRQECWSGLCKNKIGKLTYIFILEHMCHHSSVITVMSDSLRPHGLRHARFLCPPLFSGVCSNSCPFMKLPNLMLKLKLQHFGHLMWRANSLEKILILGKIEGKDRRVLWRMTWLDSITDSVDMNLRQLQEIVKDRGTWSMELQRVRHDLTTEQQ